MDIGVISVRYARALLKSATIEGVEEKIYDEMKSLLFHLTTVEPLRDAIANPMLNKESKESLLVNACAHDVSQLTIKFIHLVVEAGRAGLMQLIANAYLTLYREKKHITKGKLITATKVSDAVIDKMKRMVEGRTNGTVEFTTVINTDIIGGFILEYDTYRYDASVKNALKVTYNSLKS